MTHSFIWLETGPKRFIAWLYPAGHFVFYLWIGLGVWSTTAIFDTDIEKKYQAFAGGVFLISVGVWFLIGTYQVMFSDIKRLFIVYKLEADNGRVNVSGYYFKRDEFLISDIAQLRSFKIKDVWQHVSSFFSFADDNYQLILNDGRCFYFQGSTKGVKEMLVKLSGINEVENIGTFSGKISEKK